jgi:hypothetical protein
LEHCRRAGLEPQLGPPFTTLENALATIASGRAWTFLRATVVPDGLAGIATRALRDRSATMRLSLVTRSIGTPKAVTDMLSLARDLRDSGAFREATTR